MTLLAMRGWDDFVVWSHLAFAPAVVTALARGVYDALFLISVMVFLSVWYHREAESNKLVAKIELCSTCTLFAYGIAQCFYAPGLAVLTAEVLCAWVTVGTYLSCFYIYQNKAAYDRWHPIGLHLVPAAWALLVAALHEPLLFARFRV